MKKGILIALATCVASITINQLLSNKKSIENNIKTEIVSSSKQDNKEINKLDQEYNTRTEELNQEMENNLVASITLTNNQITINYQTLNPKLYSKEVYQMILSKQYLENLKVQQQLNLVNFDSNNHINFNNSVITAQHNPNFWKEWH